MPDHTSHFRQHELAAREMALLHRNPELLSTHYGLAEETTRAHAMACRRWPGWSWLTLAFAGLARWVMRVVTRKGQRRPMPSMSAPTRAANQA